MRLAQNLVFALLTFQGLADAGEFGTIVVPNDTDIWQLPATQPFYATGCNSSPNTYFVTIEYKKSNGIFVQIHGQSCTPDENGVIDISLVVTGTPECGIHEGRVYLWRIVYMPMPHWELVDTAKPSIQGPTCP